MRLHIDYLRSMDDSARAREACVKYLQTNLIYFYAARQDIVQWAEQKAKELGGSLERPRLDWKFAWLRVLVGWSLATRAQLFMPHLKCSVVRFWDEILFRLESRETATSQTGDMQHSNVKPALERVPEEV